MNYFLHNSVPAHPLNFHEGEALCENAFRQGGPYWHLSTNGENSQIIFKCTADFAAAINVLAICLPIYGVRLIAFVIMNNHIHLVVEGKLEDVLNAFREFCRRLGRYFSKKGQDGILDGFDCGEPIALTSLAFLRAAIAYVHRNPSAARTDALAYSYPWSSGPYYFSELMNFLKGEPFGDLTLKARREVFQGRVLPMPENYYMLSLGFISPASFVDIRKGESMFRNAADYNGRLNRPDKDVCLIARLNRSSSVLNYEEGFSVALRLAGTKFNVHRLDELTPAQKVDIAKELWYDYRLSEEHIARLLKIEKTLIKEILAKR